MSYIKTTTVIAFLVTGRYSYADMQRETKVSRGGVRYLLLYNLVSTLSIRLLTLRNRQL